MFSVTSNQSGIALYTTATPDIEMTLSPNATPSQSVIPRNRLFQFPPPRPPSKATATQKYLETETKNSCCATHITTLPVNFWTGGTIKDNHQWWAISAKTPTFSLMIHVVIPKLCTSDDKKSVNWPVFKDHAFLYGLVDLLQFFNVRLVLVDVVFVLLQPV